MTQQTAMQILFTNLESIDIKVPQGIKDFYLQMEREQIIEAFDCDGSPQPGEVWISNGEQYYRETYNKNK